MIEFCSSFFFISFFLILQGLLFESCRSGGNLKELGKIQIKETTNLFFKVFQEEDFDNVVGIYYSVVDDQDSIMVGQTFLVGTSDFDRKDTRDFSTGTSDSIAYLCFLKPNVVYALYDLRDVGECGGVPCADKVADSLLVKRLKKANPNLIIEDSYY